MSTPEARPTLPAGWRFIDDEDERQYLDRQVGREALAGHALHGVRVSALARNIDTGAVLLALEGPGGAVAEVHLQGMTPQRPAERPVRVHTNLAAWLSKA